ncbi:hypothetical protein MAUB1S_10097 [Mycolicibacterium aubagnense]
MTKQLFERHAQQFVRVALKHDQCAEAGVIEISDDHAFVYAVLNVEMPLQFASKGSSPNGVKLQERVEVRIGANYPWRSPTFFLREDFPRDLPHLSSGRGRRSPQPCLVDGSIDEYFNSFGLVEIGILQLLSQMTAWLGKAAVNALMDPSQGWEPVMRNDVTDMVVLDPDALRERISKDSGTVWLRSGFFRSVSDTGNLLGDDIYISASSELAPASGDVTAFPFSVERTSGGHLRGKTIVAAFWPSAKAINDKILPEIVETLDDLAERATELDVGPAFDQFLRRLNERWVSAPWTSNALLPIGVVFCVRRPLPLIGRNSNIELLPYIFDIAPRLRRNTLFEGASGRSAKAARQTDQVSRRLLRSVSSARDIGSVALVGCGSVGSKVGIHLARSGCSITAVTDRGMLQPHNMARHALVRDILPSAKAADLAAEISKLGQQPQISFSDVVTGLSRPAELAKIAPPGTISIINTTASLLVREALSVAATDTLTPRVTEIALFGRGNGVFILHEGKGRNPTIADLEVELGNASTPRERALLFDEKFGLKEIQIGDGCGSLTMPMTDARLSAMSAAATEVFSDLVVEDAEQGSIAIGIREGDLPTTTWRKISVPRMLTISVDGGDWTLKLSENVDRRIREEIAQYPAFETGGLLIGACSARSRTITVVDLLPAPPDSQRTPSLFVLGKSGLKSAVMKRHAVSGKRLLDVGTWHSHLAEVGPSHTDWRTAKELAAERSPPAVLLIATPGGYRCIVHDPMR